ncbi:MAG TPA: hypothetical protein PKZ76_00825 [Xanthomonadaceae bacterium]|nr:hypothetical protein [Xanthomonadaceae bacterium]
MPFRSYSREVDILGYALNWSLQAWIIMVLVVLALALVWTGRRARSGWEWRDALRRSLAIAGIAAVSVPALVVVALLVLFVVVQSGPSVDRSQAERWLGPVCSGPAGERERDLARVLPALEEPRPQGLRAPDRRALLSALARCLRGQDPAALAPDRGTLERLHEVVSQGRPDPGRNLDVNAQQEMVGILNWLLHGPDLRAAGLACADSGCAESAFRSAEVWCRRHAESCRRNLSLNDLDWIESREAGGRWGGWTLGPLRDLKRFRMGLEPETPVGNL